MRAILLFRNIFNRGAIYICPVILLACFFSHNIFAQDNKQLVPSQKRQCVSIISAKKVVKEGEEIEFNLKLEDKVGEYAQRFEWRVSGGVIIEGQGLSWIIVDTSKQGGNEIKVTVEVSGLPSDCEKTASSLIKVETPIGDRFPVCRSRYTTAKDFQICLDVLALELQADFESKALIVLFVRENNAATITKQIKNITKAHLRKRRIVFSRIKIVQAKTKDETNYEFWVLSKDEDFSTLNKEGFTVINE